MSQNEQKKTDAQHQSSGAESVFSEFGIKSKVEQEPITPQSTAESGTPTPPADEPVKEAPPAPKENERSAPTARASKPSSAKSQTVKQSNASKKPSVSKSERDVIRTSTAQKTLEKQKEQKGVKKEKESDGMFRSSKPAHRVMPYILVILALLIGITLLLNLFCNLGNKLEENPSEHWMGPIGYWVCYALFGVFGPAVFALPILLFNLGIFWKRYIDSRVTISKILVSLLALILLASFIHVFSLIADKSDISVKDLMYYGAQMTGGGVIGGKLAHLMVQGLNIAGSMILCVLLLIVSIFYCIGMTPQKIWNRICIKRALKRAEKLEKADQQKEAEENAAKKKEKQEKREKERRERDPEDKLAPMPMPTLDPSHGTRPFVPADVKRTLTQEEREARVTAPAPSSKNEASAPTPQRAQAASSAPSSVGTPVQERTVAQPASPKNSDAAIDPIFPRGSESRQARKVPRQERNFDLKKVFVDFDDTVEPQQREHAKLPPEVPMKGNLSPEQRAAVLNAEPSAKPAPSPVPAPAAKRTAPKPATATAAGNVAQQSAAVKQAPVARPISRPADTSDLKDFGLTSEEFERLEAEQGIHKRPLQSTKTMGKGEGKATAMVSSKLSNKKYVYPPIIYLHPVEPETEENKAEVEATIQQLFETMGSFNVGIREITHAHGPTVTRYELFPNTGVRVRSIVNLADDIALALAAGGIRIEAPIPGKSAVGIEVPNKLRRTVFLRQLIEDPSFTKATSKLTASLGADIAGTPLFFDISKMPHLLVAGTTNSGKSVCINCIIMSLLYKARPDEVKLLLIDPKKVEFGVYKNIPHLLAPIVNTPKDAAGALQASVEEMERRFNLFEQVGARDIKGYNETTKNDPDMPFLPYIVIIIDELADLMMTASDEVETAICRIAQKARAAGMHLIAGTQRPSVDVVTGLIKSNIPSRIAFTVASQVDSKTILDYAGAEKLSGRGDMLFAPIGALKPARVQGAFVDEKEVERICEFIRATNGTAQYDETFISKLKELAAQCGNKGKGGGGGEPSGASEGGDGKGDNLYADAVRVAVEENRISTSLLQRKLSVGYSRAAKMIDRMQSEGIVSAPDGSKPRTVLITADDYITRFIDNKDEANGADKDAE